jgi:hypothetical protein
MTCSFLFFTGTDALSLDRTRATRLDRVDLLHDKLFVVCN